MPVQNHNSKNGTQLNHNQEKILKILGYVQINKFIYKDHVPGTADGQPLCDPFNNPKDHYFEKFNDIQMLPFPLSSWK